MAQNVYGRRIAASGPKCTNGDDYSQSAGRHHDRRILRQLSEHHADHVPLQQQSRIDIRFVDVMIQQIRLGEPSAPDSHGAIGCYHWFAGIQDHSSELRYRDHVVEDAALEFFPTRPRRAALRRHTPEAHRVKRYAEQWPDLFAQAGMRAGDRRCTSRQATRGLTTTARLDLAIDKEAIEQSIRVLGQIMAHRQSPVQLAGYPNWTGRRTDKGPSGEATRNGGGLRRSAA